MKLKSTGKKILSAMLAAVMTFSVMASTAVSSVSAEPAEAGFADKLESEYVDPDRVYSSDVRWWIGEAANTDQALLEEIQMLYDSGFRGVELCMQSDNGAPDDLYAYGSEMWSHKWKLMMNKLLDLGMTVSLTSGTNWATSNVPGLAPSWAPERSLPAARCLLCRFLRRDGRSQSFWALTPIGKQPRMLWTMLRAST